MLLRYYDSDRRFFFAECLEGNFSAAKWLQTMIEP